MNDVLAASIMSEALMVTYEVRRRVQETDTSRNGQNDLHTDARQIFRVHNILASSARPVVIWTEEIPPPPPPPMILLCFCIEFPRWLFEILGILGTRRATDKPTYLGCRYSQSNALSLCTQPVFPPPINSPFPSVITSHDS